MKTFQQFQEEIKKVPSDQNVEIPKILQKCQKETLKHTTNMVENQQQQISKREVFLNQRKSRFIKHN